MPAEVGRPAFVVRSERRLIFVHLDLFDDHLLFGFEILFSQCRAKNIAEQFHDRLLKLREHSGVVDGALLAGESIVVSAHLIELAVDVVGAPRGGSLEHHVLEKVAHSGDVGGLIASAGLHEEAERRRMGVVVALGNDLEAVAETCFEKSHASSKNCTFTVLEV